MPDPIILGTLYVTINIYHPRRMGRKEMQEGVSQARRIISMAVLTVMVEWYTSGLAMA